MKAVTKVKHVDGLLTLNFGVLSTALLVGPAVPFSACSIVLVVVVNKDMVN